MWRRIGIVACAAVVIGVGARMLSAQRNGSVEYHKKAFLKAWKAPKWYGVAPRVVRDAWDKRRGQRIDFHWAALVDAGYATNGEFVVSNVSAWGVAQAVRGRVSELGSNYSDFVWVSGTDKDMVLFMAPVAAMSQLGEWVREADAPKIAEETW